MTPSATSAATAAQRITAGVGCDHRNNVTNAIAAVATRKNVLKRTTSGTGASHVNPACSHSVPSRLTVERVRSRNHVASRDGPAKNRATITTVLNIETVRI